MRLFFDEDAGGSIPRALHQLGIRCAYVGPKGIPKGTLDETWIPIAGQRRYLVFSCNTAILDAEAQRELWIKHNVGGVFLKTGQERRIDVMILILKKLEWLRQIDKQTPRPFAYTLTINGKWHRDSRVRAPDGADPTSPSEAGAQSS